MPIYVLVPCRRFGVRAHLAFSEGLSLLEQFALRCLAARPMTAAALARTLGLDERMALDLGVDLVKAGLAELHGESGELRPSDLVLSAMRDPAKPTDRWAARFASERAPEAEEVMLFQEMISGGVFALRREERGSATLPIASESPSIPTIEKVERTAIAAAAARALEQRRSRRREREAGNGDADFLSPGLQVVDVSLASAGGIQAVAEANSSRERIRFELDVRLDDSGAISDILVVGPVQVPRSVRRGIGRGLVSQLAAGVRQSGNEFFGVLRDRARTAQTSSAKNEGYTTWNPPERLRSLREAVASAVARVKEEGSSSTREHERLLERWQQAYDEVVEAAAYRSRVSLVTGTAAHFDLALEALKTAAHQVVLMCPWVAQLGRNTELRQALSDAVERGVRVHVIWGIDVKETRQTWEPAAQEIASRLAKSGHGALHCNDRGAGVHAKFIAKDHDWAVVSTCNFLNAARDRSAIELGALVRHPDGRSTVAGPTAEEPLTRVRFAGTLPATLTWSRSVIPDFDLRRALVTEPILGAPIWLPPPIRLRDDFPAPQNEWVAQQFWPKFWEGHVESAEKSLQAIGTFAQPVFDLEHRHLLFDELETARDRLIVTSDKLGVGLLGKVPFDAAADAVRQRGLKLTVVYAEDPADAEHLRRRDELAALGVRFVKADMHAKVLVADDRATITSFNFLSFEGVSSGRRPRRELGVRVFDRAFADSIAAVLTSPGRDVPASPAPQV